VKGLISVEDVVQETLAKAFLKIDRFRGESRHSFAAWLLAIGDMTLIDLVRRETRQARGGQFERQKFASDSVKGSLVDLLAQLPGEEKTGSQIVAHEEGVAALQVAIAGLPHDQRQAISCVCCRVRLYRRPPPPWIAHQRPFAASSIELKRVLPRPWEEHRCGLVKTSLDANTDCLRNHIWS
jgi:hypothetical protein